MTGDGLFLDLSSGPDRMVLILGLNATKKTGPSDIL